VASSASSSPISPVGTEQKSLQTEKRDTKMEPYSPSTTPGVDETPFIQFALDQLTRDEDVRGSRHYVGGDDDESEDSDDFQRDIITAESSQRPATTTDDMAQQKEMHAGAPPQHPLHQFPPQPPENTLNPLQQNPLPPSVQPYDVFVPFDPAVPSHQHPRLDFLPGILRPLWLGAFIFLCFLMLAGLIFCAVWSDRRNGLWGYKGFGDNRYFVFEYLPTMLGMVILIWLFQVQTAVQRVAPFIAMASHSLKARSESAFLDLYPTQFLYPKFQHFRSGQPIIGASFFIFWLFIFSIPLLASAFNVRYFGNVGSGTWRWVAVQGVIWTVVALYILLIVALFVLGAYLWRSITGLKWDPRSLADIIALLERANIVSDYSDTETYANSYQFRQRLWSRADRVGYWHTSRRPQDIFYGIGEEGAPTRRYSIEQGRIREKPRHAANQPSISTVESIEPQTPHAAGDFSIRSDIRNPEVRRRYIPWYLSTSSVTLWILIALALLAAFLVVAFVNQASIKGFLPATSATTNSAGFSSAAFLYSFVPAVIGTLLFLLWQPLDLAYRRLAPFAALATGPRGSIAEKSLLLDYTAKLPVSVTFAAASNGHWKVAVLSVMSLANSAIPVLAGGIFWPQWYSGSLEVRIAAQPAGLYALCVFLALYFAALAVAVPPGRRTLKLPHAATSLAEIISWLYMSPLLVDRVFARCRSKADLVTRLVGAPPYDEEDDSRKGFWASVSNLVNRSRAHLPRGHDDGEARPSEKVARPAAVADDSLAPFGDQHQGPVRTYLQHPGGKIRYGFGVYIGRDGREHLGIDRVRRGGRDMVLFEDGSTDRKSWMGF